MRPNVLPSSTRPISSLPALPALLAGALAVALLPPAALAADPPPREAARAFAAIVDGSPLSGARVGILVSAVDTGEVIYARDPDVLLNPASNVKLVTSAAALDRLGPEYRFATEFLVEPKGGAARALYVRGKGDPSIVTERLWAMAGDLQHLGVKRIGELVVDEGFFDGERTGPGYDQEEGDRAYLAPAGALSLNFNAVAVHVGPGDRRGARGRVELEPASDYLEIENRTTTVRAGSPRRVIIESVARGGRQRIVVKGRVPLGSRTQPQWRRIEDPALYLGHTLARLLELRGVKVGKVRAGATPEGARLVLVAQSDPLGEIVRRLNKTSNNFVAEQLLKTLGAEVKGAPGTWPKGVQVVEEFLAEAGVPRGTYVMKNGSGLNDTNRFSARQLVTLLRAMYGRFPIQPEYLASLPVAGRDGTIRWRMEGTEAAGRLRAKTGTLENVTSLSGYVEDGAHRTLAFAVLVNDYPGRSAGVRRAVDALGAALAASGGPPAGLEAAVAQGKEPGPAAVVAVAATTDLARSAQPYYALARTGDPRNEPFLRGALRAEADPALRLAIAEAVYLSDPEGEAARRSFLDQVTPDAGVLGRLWSAMGTEEPPPVVPSIAELAGEGVPEALAKLVELAPAAALDGGLAARLAEALAGVAASAPDELVQALRAARASDADAAVGALGAGLARSDEREHPFPPALAALAGRQDELGAYARALGPRLEEARRAAEAVRAAPVLVPVPVPVGGAVVPASGR
ncbi:D-alanyl-D-alanine carboxypeptidase DacC [Anaeromyxobacter sp. PSR-1]|nr:D-alanyl-D-alanine carboxypeptidase DacC [Anaeromyxobacter sp. PSR-1]